MRVAVIGNFMGGLLCNSSPPFVNEKSNPPSYAGANSVSGNGEDTNKKPPMLY